MHHQLLRLAATTSLVVACGAPESSPVGVATQAVRGGEPTGDAHAGVLYVVSEIRNVGGTVVSKIGSSALVAPNLLATALHVVSENPSNVPFTCNASGDAVSGSSGASLGATVAPGKITVFAGPTPTGEPLAHGVKVVSTGSTTICQNDLAFVVLDQSLDLPTYPLRNAGPVHLGDELEVVGYGSGLSTTTETAVRTERTVSVAAIGQWIRTFTVTVGPCEGDSGGPALSPEGALVGVFSSVAMDCTGPTAAPKYTDLSFFSPLVELAFAEANAGSPWPTSGAGGAGGDSSHGEAGTPTGSGGESPTSTDVDQSDSSGCALGIAKTRLGNAGAALVLFSAALSLRVRRRGQT
jgi:Trypsin-like peptidase domain